LDSSQRPSQSPQRYDLLFLFIVQDIAHNDGGYRPRVEIKCPERCLSLAGFQVIMYGRFWVFTEATTMTDLITIEDHCCPRQGRVVMSAVESEGFGN
jgi:hypothetical protein